MKDQEFISFFGLILGVLVVITVFVFVIANILSDDHATMDTAMVIATKQRIEPVGKVNIGTVPAAAMPTAHSQTGSSPAAMSPQATYESACQSCHLAGVLESPKLEDTAQWKMRVQERSVGGLYTSVINGRGNMPAKGGRVDLSDENIKLVVDYMLKKAGATPQ